MSSEDDKYIEGLYNTNEELEVSIQMLSDEKDALEQRLVAKDKSIKLLRSKYNKLRKAGDRLAKFIDGLLIDGSLYDEEFDIANSVLEKWEDNK